MELREAIEKRTSVRAFTKQGVNPDHIREMVRRGGLAPSVNNFQPWRFILVQSKDLMEEMAELVLEKLRQLEIKESKLSSNIRKQVEWYSTFFTEAPALLVLVMQKYESVLEKSTQISHDEINLMRAYPDIQSAGACVQNILLTATEMGYGACWLSGPVIAREEIENRLKLGDDERLICFIALGHPLKKPEPRKKEDLGSRLVVL